MKRVLEVCVDSLESALAAAKGGASRLELCANLIIGGTTPSLSLLRAVKEEVGLPVHAMVRPRFGDFLYSEREFDLMLKDADLLLQNGADALVCGCLTAEGDLDLPRIRALTDLAHTAGRRFTLHRAFDLCRDPMAALAACRDVGVDTILTSGQENHCLDGIALLKKLLSEAGDIEILIGAGVDADVIRQIRADLPDAQSFHMSGKVVRKSGMRYCKVGVSMGLPGLSEYEIYQTAEEKIRAAKAALEE